MADTQVAGRLTENEHGKSGVVIDGRRSWEQLGQALGLLDGWEFRICFQAAQASLTRIQAAASAGSPNRGGGCPLQVAVLRRRRVLLCSDDPR